MIQSMKNMKMMNDAQLQRLG